MLKLSALVRLLKPCSLSRGRGLTTGVSSTWTRAEKGPRIMRQTGAGTSVGGAHSTLLVPTGYATGRAAFEIRAPTAYKRDCLPPSQERTHGECVVVLRSPRCATGGRAPHHHAARAVAQRRGAGEVPRRLPPAPLPVEDPDLPPGRQRGDPLLHHRRLAGG